MKNNISTLVINFNFSDWENQIVRTFRDSIESFIGLKHARTSVLLSTELNKSGISFFFMTSDNELSTQIQLKFGMKTCSENINTKVLGVEYGNLELIS